jgi:hypothetical protein
MTDLKKRVTTLNRMLGRPEECWHRGENAELTASIGNLHIYKSHFGYELHEVANGSGAVRQHGTTHKKAGEMMSYLGGILDGVTFSRGGN